MIKLLRNTIFNTDLTNSLFRLDKSRAYLLNALIFSNSAVLAVVVAINLFLGVYVSAVMECVFIALSIVAYLLNRKKYYSTATIYYISLLIISTLTITLFAYSQGRFTETENVLIVCLFVSTVMLDGLISIVMAVFLISLLFTLKVYKYVLQYGTLDDNFALVIVNMLLVTLMIAVFTIIFKYSLNKAYRENKKQKDVLFSLIDNIPVWVAMIDKDRKYVMANQYFVETFGVEREKLIGSYIANILPEAINKIHKPLYEKAFKGETQFFFEKTFLPNGKMIYARGKYVPIVNPVGEIDNVTVHVYDVSELKKTEDLLLRTNKVARIGGWEFDVLKNKIYWSGMAREIHEVPDSFIPDEANLFAFYTTLKGKNRILNAYEKSKIDGLPWSIDTKIETYKNNKIWVRVKGVGDFVEGKCVRLFGTIQEITKEKEIENAITKKNKKLKKLTSQLHKSNQTKDRLFSIVSHDLRGPIHAIKGIINLYNKKALTEDEMSQLFKKLISKVETNEVLINDLLKWSKSQIKGFVVNRKEFNLVKLIDENIAQQNNKADAKEISVINRVDNHVTPVADVDMINFVIRNLLANAIKFTHPQGVIVFETENLGDKIMVNVKDNGVGIEPEIIKKILNDELHTSNGTDGETGTGLGLTICNDFLKKNDSVLQIKSDVNNGASFYFNLHTRPQLKSIK